MIFQLRDSQSAPPHMNELNYDPAHRVHNPPSALEEPNSKSVAMHGDQEGLDPMVVSKGSEYRIQVLVGMEGVAGRRERIVTGERGHTHCGHVDTDHVASSVMAEPRSDDSAREVTRRTVTEVLGGDGPP